MKSLTTLGLLGLVGCAEPSSILVRLATATPGAAPTLLSLKVTSSANVTRTRVLPPKLPGTVIVFVPDTPLDVTLDAIAIVDAGQMLESQTTVRTVPHRQVTIDLVLGSTVDLGSSPDLTPNVVAHDDFNRPNRSRWGVASDGQTWGADANSSPAFSIVSLSGRFNSGSTTLDAILGPMVTDGEVLVTSSIDDLSGTNNIGATLRWNDTNNFYKLEYHAADCAIIKKVGNIGTILASTPRSFVASTFYSIRFRAIGTTLMGRFWPAGTPEPSSWDLQTTDSSFAAGYCGVRPSVSVVTTVTATVSSFTAARF